MLGLLPTLCLTIMLGKGPGELGKRMAVGRKTYSFLGSHAGGPCKGGNPEEAIREQALVGHVRQRPVEANPHWERDERGQAARQGVDLCLLVQPGNLHLNTCQQNLMMLPLPITGLHLVAASRISGNVLPVVESNTEQPIKGLPPHRKQITHVSCTAHDGLCGQHASPRMAL